MNSLTEAAVLFETGQPLRLIELGIPDLQPGQVLVDIAYSGVCRSQVNEVRGHKGRDAYVPHTLGHEGAGIVVAIGPNVTKVVPGDRVVLSWLVGSGISVPRTVYNSAYGPVNSGAISTFMRQTITCESRVTVIPPDMPLREAALLGCAVPTGAGIVHNTVKLAPGNSVAVFGTGGIGLVVIMAAAAAGASPLIAIDISPEKLAMAVELGATHTINAGDTDVLAALRALTGGKGVDVAVETAGRIEAAETAFEAVRTGGGQCVIAGNPPVGQTIRLNPFSLISGRNIRGSWGGESQVDVDIPRYIQDYREGRLSLQRLISHEYSLATVNQAVDDLEAGRVLRALLAINPQ